MKKMTSATRARLRKAAEAAKKAAGGGTWARWTGSAQVGRLNRPGATNNEVEFQGDTFIECEHIDDGFDRSTKARRIARFVAAADPDTMLALLDALDASEAKAS